MISTKNAVCRDCVNLRKGKFNFFCSCLPCYDNIVPDFYLDRVHTCCTFLQKQKDNCDNENTNKNYICSNCYYYRNRRCHNIENALLIDDDIILGGSLEGEGIHLQDFDISPKRKHCSKFKYLESV